MDTELSHRIKDDVVEHQFVCAGVLVDTERDGHRISFNQAFKAKGRAMAVVCRNHCSILGINTPVTQSKHNFPHSQPDITAVAIVDH